MEWIMEICSLQMLVVEISKLEINYKIESKSQRWILNHVSLQTDIYSLYKTNIINGYWYFTTCYRNGILFYYHIEGMWRWNLTVQEMQESMHYN